MFHFGGRSAIGPRGGAPPLNGGGWAARRRGLTLLELLLVVFILSMLAFSAASLTNTMDEQFRYEETQRRLEGIRRGIVGETEPAFNGQRLLSGFVVDMGALPTAVESLVLEKSQLDETQLFDRKAAIFDPDPTDGFNDGSANEVILDEPSELVLKGYRGPYLQLRAGAERFRDGWGNVSDTDDAANHGWGVTQSLGPNGFPVALAVTSLGLDGEPGGGVSGENIYWQDVSENLEPADWGYIVDSLTGTVENNSKASVSNLRVSLLIYIGTRTAEEGQWLRITSDLFDVDANSTATVTFSQPDSGPIVLPIGQHLLVLVKDNNGTMHNPDDRIVERAGERLTRRVELFPRTTPLPLSLTIQQSSSGPPSSM